MLKKEAITVEQKREYLTSIGVIVDNNAISNTEVIMKWNALEVKPDMPRVGSGGIEVNHIDREGIDHGPKGEVLEHIEAEADRLCGNCKKPKQPLHIPYDQTEGYCICRRPSKYTPELLEKAWEYVEFKMPHNETNENIHSIEGLCIWLNIHRDTAHTWAKDSNKETFSDIYEAVQQHQASFLVNKGVTDQLSNPIAKLLMVKHGYRDSVENINREIPVDPSAKAASDAAIDEYLKGNKQ